MEQNPQPTYYPTTPVTQQSFLNSKLKIIITILVIITAAIIVLIFLFSPTIFGAPDKPQIRSSLREQKTITDNSVISSQDVDFLTNELGAYVLRANPFNGEKPEIEVYISDTSQYFDVTVENNVPSTSEHKANNPDIRIIVSKDTFIKAVQAKNVNEEVLKLYNDGKVNIVILKSFDVMALKGYKQIYDALYSGSTTGSVLISFINSITRNPSRGLPGLYF